MKPGEGGGGGREPGRQRLLRGKRFVHNGSMLRNGAWLLLVAACTSNSGTGADAPPATADGGATYSCARSLDVYCASTPTCVRMWKDIPRCGGHLGTRQCGAATAFVTTGVDMGRTDYYDETGKLVAIVAFGIVPVGCVAGPSPFFAPACGDVTPLPPCADAGP